MMYPRWTDSTKRIVAVIGIVLILLLLYVARGIMISLLLAGALAYALHPIVSFLQRRLRFPHTLATIVVYLLLLVVLVATPILLVPIVIGQIQTINVNLATLVTDTREWLISTLESWRTVVIFGNPVNLSSVIDPALNSLKESDTLMSIPPPETWLPQVFGTLSGVAFTLTSTVFAFLLTLLYSFHLLKDTHQWGRRLDDLVPERYQPEWEILQRQLNDIWGAFFRGQLLFSLVMALATFALLAILGVPGSVPLALLVGVLEIIPNIGPIIALVPIGVVTLIQGASILPMANGWDLLVVAVIYIVVQVVGTNILAPYIFGKSVNLSPLVLLVGVVLGASIAGLIGAFLATPVLATLRVVAAYAYNKILDRPPFPELAPSEAAEETVPAHSSSSPAGTSAAVEGDSIADDRSANRP